MSCCVISVETFDMRQRIRQKPSNKLYKVGRCCHLSIKCSVPILTTWMNIKIGEWRSLSYNCLLKSLGCWEGWLLLMLCFTLRKDQQKVLLSQTFRAWSGLEVLLRKKLGCESILNSATCWLVPSWTFRPDQFINNNNK